MFAEDLYEVVGNIWFDSLQVNDFLPNTNSNLIYSRATFQWKLHEAHFEWTAFSFKEDGIKNYFAYENPSQELTAWEKTNRARAYYAEPVVGK